MTTLDQTLDMAMALPFEQRQILIDILAKRHISERREEIAENARETIRAFHAGELQTETAEQLIERLHDSPEDEND